MSSLVPGYVTVRVAHAFKRLKFDEVLVVCANGDGHMRATGGPGAKLLSEWVRRPGGQLEQAQHQRPEVSASAQHAGAR